MSQRYQMVARHSGDGGLYVRPLGDADGEWMRHSDHLAALEAARREAREGALKEAASLLGAKAQDAKSRRARALAGGFVEALEDGKAHAYAEASDCVRAMVKRPEPEGGE